MKRIGIVGSRRRDAETDFNEVWATFAAIYEDGDQIVSGGCPKGGDRFAEVIAKDQGIPITIFYPRWKRQGHAAGFIRNTHIAEAADMLIACVAPDRTGGTEDTIQKFVKLGKPDPLLV